MAESKLDFFMDGGVRNGTDVLIALSYGLKAVGIGLDERLGDGLLADRLVELVATRFLLRGRRLRRLGRCLTVERGDPVPD